MAEVAGHLGIPKSTVREQLFGRYRDRRPKELPLVVG